MLIQLIFRRLDTDGLTRFRNEFFGLTVSTFTPSCFAGYNGFIFTNIFPPTELYCCRMKEIFDHLPMMFRRHLHACPVRRLAFEFQYMKRTQRFAEWASILQGCGVTHYSFMCCLAKKLLDFINQMINCINMSKSVKI